MRSFAANVADQILQYANKPAAARAALFVTASLLAVLAFAGDAERKAASAHAAASIPQVVVTAKRPPAADKDIPKVVVTAKRMTPEQKRAYDEAQARLK